MATTSKNRRPIEVDGRSYLWWVAADDETSLTLTVVSEDKRFLVKYRIAQNDDTRHVIVMGSEFGRWTGCGGPWRRFRSPAFGQRETVTPKDVAALVRWASAADDAVLEVNWLGHALRPDSA